MTKGKSVFKLIVAEISGLAMTFIPLALWWFEDYSSETVMLLYWLESIISVVLSVLCFVILVPAKGDVEKPTRSKGKILSDFLWIVGMMMLVVSVFVLWVVFLRKVNSPVPLEHFKTGLMIILAFQLFEFFTNLFLLRPLSAGKGTILLEQSLGGFALLMVSIFLGGFIALFTGKHYWFVLLFIVFKTIIDIVAPIQFLRGKKPAEFEPLHPHATYKTELKFLGKQVKR